jgi:CRP-like cAMP-binding protein
LNTIATPVERLPVRKPETPFLLRKIDLFTDADTSLLQKIYDEAAIKHGMKGHIMFLNAAEVTEKKVFFILQGRIKHIRLSQDGDEKIRDVLFQGDTFWSAPSILNADYVSIDSANTVLLSIKDTFLKNTFQENAPLMDKYLNLLESRMRRIDLKYEMLGLSDVKSRLFSLLMEYAKRMGVYHSGCWEMENFLTHQELGQLVFASRQSILVALDSLKKDSKVIFERKKVLVYEHE